MISIYNFFILLCTFIIYLHIIKHITFPCFENIYEVDYINNSNIQESCNINKPFLFEYQSFDPALFNNINIDSLMKNKFLNVNIHNTNNNKTVVKNFNKAINLFKKYKTKYFTINNNTLLLNHNIISNFSNFHNNLKPNFIINTNYDIISGSLFSTTPLYSHSYNTSFIVVVQGKISVKTVSYNYADEFDFKLNQDNLTYSSPVDIWNFKNKKNLPIIDFEVFPGYVLFLPSHAIYSIKFTDENTLLWNISYDSPLTYAINSFNDTYNIINKLMI
jgi:hypothetical protein|tara:strand:- start:922 stop:1746 length:825 start_codon:yes stop_codon:yes gene_type:complete